MPNSFVTPWTVAHQAHLSMEFPRQEYWSGLPFPSPGDLPDPWIKPASSAWQVDSLPLSHLGSPFLEYYITARKCFLFINLLSLKISLLGSQGTY